MVEQGPPDVVGLVINEALHAALERSDTAQATGLTRVLAYYFDLGLKPTPLEEISQPLRGRLLGHSHDLTSAQGNGSVQTYEDLLPMSFYSPIGRLDLTATEHRILAVLYANKDQVMNRGAITRAVFVGEASSSLAFGRTIDVHVNRIRRKFGNPREAQEVIRSVHGRGYLLSDPDRLIRVGSFSEADPPALSNI